MRIYDSLSSTLAPPRLLTPDGETLTEIMLQVVKLSYPANTDICDIFQHFSSEPWAMLLDSADAHGDTGNYSILVARPLMTVEFQAQQNHITDFTTQQQRTEAGDPLEWVEKLSQRLFSHLPKQQTALPFQAGALGLFGYDLGRAFETMPESAEQDIQCPDMAVGFYSWSIIHCQQSNQFYLCYDAAHWHPNKEELENRSLAQPCTNEPFRLTRQWQSNMSYADYAEKFNQVQSFLHAGDCYQVNLAQRFNAAYEGDEWLAYRQLRQRNQAPFSAFIRLKDHVILSVSPERFLRVQAGQVETKPIKGTRPRFADPQQDELSKQALQQASKDRAENLMIVDLLRNDLSKSCLPGSVKVPKLFDIESYPAVHHLVSTVTGCLDENLNSLALLKGAFPGGSITGAPKIRAMQIIEQLEPHRRNIYCGSIGYINHQGDMDSNICIRTLLCEHGKIYCWAGGGLVVDSDCRSEYEETLHKINKILPVLTEN